ncbi:MAG: hypothetical protein J7L39_02040 [Candidatus Aenigmarchaeota archaeon]|nr:hypothetical protein [Candidatus Aenigmarchaeota archaeon]
MARKDWKDCLPEEDKKILAELLLKAKRHECAYMQADDVKVAQLWCALIELAKEFGKIKEDVEKVKEPFIRIVEIGEAEKRKAIEKLIESLIRPSSDEEKEATKKLVDTLMKF